MLNAFLFSDGYDYMKNQSQRLETLSKRLILVKVKVDEDFNHRNTGSILGIKT